MFGGRASCRDAAYLVALGIILLAGDWALAVFADPKINPAFGRHVVMAVLIALGVIGAWAAAVGCYRFVRPTPVQEHEARANPEPR